METLGIHSFPTNTCGGFESLSIPEPEAEDEGNHIKMEIAKILLRAVNRWSKQLSQTACPQPNGMN
jgi:hypothetical protein